MYLIKENNAFLYNGTFPVCRSGNLDVVKILIEAGADIDAVCYDLWTPLHYAINNVSKIIIIILNVYRIEVTTSIKNKICPSPSYHK